MELDKVRSIICNLRSELKTFFKTEDLEEKFKVYHEIDAHIKDLLSETRELIGSDALEDIEFVLSFRSKDVDIMKEYSRKLREFEEKINGKEPIIEGIVALLKRFINQHLTSTILLSTWCVVTIVYLALTKEVKLEESEKFLLSPEFKEPPFGLYT